MDLTFVDDAVQRPSRPGFKGKLVAAGALSLPADHVKQLSGLLDEVCGRYGFPSGEEFKWSPGKECWMRSNLTGAMRQEFYVEIIEQLASFGASGIVVLEDAGRKRANRELDVQQDVIVMLLERIANRLRTRGETGLVVADRPGGGRKAEDAFLADCGEALEMGTKYVQHNEIAFVVTADSTMVRLLQAADLLTSCIAAYVAGEQIYSPIIARKLMPLLTANMERIGGYGVKIHPDFCFANLYHWLFGDEDFWKGNAIGSMPLPGFPYAAGPDIA